MWLLGSAFFVDRGTIKIEDAWPNLPLGRQDTGLERQILRGEDAAQPIF
jgi:hypothetical protein